MLLFMQQVSFATVLPVGCGKCLLRVNRLRQAFIGFTITGREAGT